MASGSYWIPRNSPDELDHLRRSEAVVEPRTTRLDPLEAARLIEQQPDPADRGGVLIQLSRPDESQLVSTAIDAQKTATARAGLRRLLIAPEAR